MNAPGLVRSIASVARLGAALATRRSLPFSMGFILTNRCNFRCVYCNVPAAAGDEMSEAEFRGAIDQFIDAGMARASFSGGEVMLRDDALAIIRHAKSRGLFTSVNTNAWFSNTEADSLAPILDMLVTSLDGPEAVHDTVRRHTGSYQRVLELIRRMQGQGVAVATITVLGPWNLDSIEWVLETAAHNGFHSYFQPAYADCFHHEQGIHPALTPQVLDDVTGRIAAARERGLPVASSPGYLERLRGGHPFGDCGRCLAGRYFGTVMPDGFVVPCHLTSDGPYLNGREVGFARAFREMPHPTHGPGCAITPFQESDLLFSLDPGAIRSAVGQILAARRQRARVRPYGRP